MKFKNKMVITTKNKRYECFNNLLLPVLNFIGEQKSYSSFLAIGTGTSPTNSGTKTLDCCTHVLPLSLDAFNFDIFNGNLFVTKKLVLDSSNSLALEITEAGLTPQVSKNPLVANRFIVNNGEPIFRDPYEEMTIEVSIFLEFDHVGGLNLVYGDNNFARLLLGVEPTTIDGGFSVGRGEDTTPNKYNIATNIVGESYPLDLSFEVDEQNKTLNLELSGNIGSGEVKELVVCYKNTPALRINVVEVCGLQTGLESEGVADYEGDVSFFIPFIFELESVKNSATGETIEEVKIDYFATGFSGAEEVFNKKYSATTKRVVSSDLSQIAFFGDNWIDVYTIENGVISQRDTSTIALNNIYLVALLENLLFIKCVGTDGKYPFYYYSYKTGKYIKRQNYLGVRDGTGYGLNDNWVTMDLGFETVNDQTQFVFMTHAQRETGNHVLKYYDTYGNLSQVYLGTTATFNSRNLCFMPPTSYAGYMVCAYDSNNDRLIYWLNKKSAVACTDPIAKRVVNFEPKDSFSPRAAKNHAFNIDSANKKMYFFSLKDLTGKELEFVEAEKIYASRRLDYIATKLENQNAIRFYYVDASLNLYPFGSDFYPDKTVLDLEFVDGGVLVFYDSSEIEYKKLNESKPLLKFLEPAKSYTINYSLDNTPGKGGEEVKPKFKVFVKLDSTIS